MNVQPAQYSSTVLIRRVGVLGAGTMGARIAAHIANAGLPVVLLDMVPVGPAIDRLMKSKPAAFYDPAAVRLITPGSFETDMGLLADCDWIIEAVAEDLDIKRRLLERVAAHRKPGAIVTTNTSGLPVNQIAEGMSEEFRRHWFGTHFFNPPRYMRLLEIIPTPETDPASICAVERFADRRLGKTPVFANDTPNFIANRIGTFAMLNAVRVMQEMDLSIEQVDALTGSALGWPKTGTFRLADMVGIDVLASVARNFRERVSDERSDVALPAFVEQMLERKWLGDKAGQGFYRKLNDARLALDWKTLEYRPAARASFPSLEMARNVESTAERVKVLLAGDPRKDVATAFYWRILPDLWSYAAHRVGEVSDDVHAIDTAMKTGFNWELGPFELWDAAGVPETVARMRAAGVPAGAATERLLAAGHTSWYRDRFVFHARTEALVPVRPLDGSLSFDVLRRVNGVVATNPGASLIDLGDGVACIELHSKMNAIGADIVNLVTAKLKPGSTAVQQFEAFVLSTDAQNFSVGANLMQLLLAVQEQEWDEIDLMIRGFQAMTQAIRFSPRPVVAAPAGMCLGGGAEMCLHAVARQPHAELYIGLVEAGVGLIPAGGGCKEMTLRATGRPESPELFASLQRKFETVAMAKVSTSAAEARTFGLLDAADRVTMNRARLLADAKARALELARAGYVPPAPRSDIPAAGENVLATLRMAVRTMREAEYISDHDVKVANKIAHVLCSGKLTPGTPVSEQYLLDLEREAFLSLCGERKTQDRIAHTLKTGKPLRN